MPLMVFRRMQRRVWLDVALPWAILVGVAVALYEMWPLIFMAFIMGSLAGKAADRIAARWNWRRRVALGLIYAIIALMLNVLVWVVVPRIYAQTRAFVKTLPALVQDTYDHVQTSAQGSLGDVLPKEILASLREDSIKYVSRHMDDEGIAKTLHLLATGGRLILFVFLAVILSLLVQWDIEGLRQSVGRLEHGRAGPWYKTLTPPVIEFSNVVAEVFDAQLVIALVNTSMTCLAMIALGIKYVAFLSMLVFVCGLIPVLGVFISSVPILFLALQGGGFALATKALVCVLCVHGVETYVLNPRIMGGHLRVHPVTVLLTLLVGEHYFGVWGVLLGLPTATFAARKLLAPIDPPGTAPAHSAVPAQYS